MKKIVMCLAIMMAFSIVTVGCSSEKKEEVKPAGMVGQGANKMTEAPPAVVVPEPKPAVTGTDMGQMNQGAVQELAPLPAEPVAGVAGQAVETGQAVVQEGAGGVQGDAGTIKQETDQAVEAPPEGAGGVVVDEEAARKAVVPAK